MVRDAIHGLSWVCITADTVDLWFVVGSGMGDSGANRIGQTPEVPAQDQLRVCATDAEIGQGPSLLLEDARVPPAREKRRVGADELAAGTGGV